DLGYAEGAELLSQRRPAAAMREHDPRRGIGPRLDVRCGFPLKAIGPLREGTHVVDFRTRQRHASQTLDLGQDLPVVVAGHNGPLEPVARLPRDRAVTPAGAARS